MENEIKISYKVADEFDNSFPYYTSDKGDAKKRLAEMTEDFGGCNLYEITEEWNEEDQDWETIEENIILSTLKN